MSVAGVAHPVERHLAKVEVASSSLVARSIKMKDQPFGWSFFLPCDEGSNNQMQESGGLLLDPGSTGSTL